MVSQNRNNGNAGELSGNRCLGPSTRDIYAGSASITSVKSFDIVLTKSFNLVHFRSESGS